MGDPVYAARARIASAVRNGNLDAERQARVELTEAHLERFIDSIMAREHKPRPDVVDRILARLSA